MMFPISHIFIFYNVEFSIFKTENDIQNRLHQTISTSVKNISPGDAVNFVLKDSTHLILLASALPWSSSPRLVMGDDVRNIRSQGRVSTIN